MKRGKAKGARDYKAEYRARLKRALDLGYSRSVARGHPRHNKNVVELGIRAAARLSKATGKKVKAGTDIREVINADRRYTFGGKEPKIQQGDRDDGGISAYMMRLAELKRKNGYFRWDNEEEFIKQMTDLGMSERQAYTTLLGS